MQATANLPQVVSLPQATEEITQLELELFLSLKQQLAQLEERIEFHEQRFRERLQAGAGVEPGLLHATLKVTERRNVSWRGVVESLVTHVLKADAGAYCREILNETEPTSSVRLVVEVQS